MLSGRDADTAADDNDNGGGQSATEGHEHTHQRHPLKGDSGTGSPQKLGELIAAVHFVLKRESQLEKTEDKLVQAKGILLDKMLGAIHVTLSTSCPLKPGVEVSHNCLSHSIRKLKLSLRRHH